jgi:AhpD family alkylhydroperoxidase
MPTSPDDPVRVPTRLDLPRIGAPAYAAVRGLEDYVRSSSVPAALRHLVYLRASFLNGCTYCIDLHSREAQRDGEPAARLFAVASWRESSFFTRAERAALAMTDALTRLGPEGLPDDVWAEARTVFSEAEIVDLVTAIVAINAWNRIAISTRVQPPAPGTR